MLKPPNRLHITVKGNKTILLCVKNIYSYKIQFRCKSLFGFCSVDFCLRQTNNLNMKQQPQKHKKWDNLQPKFVKNKSVSTSVSYDFKILKRSMKMHTYFKNKR